MVSWFKHDIPAWMDGTESLSDGAYRVYHVICQLIYFHEGSITLNKHGIAGRCRQSVRAFTKNLNELLAAKKLTLENGRLSNSRSNLEIEKIAENRINAGKGGEKSGQVRKVRSKALEDNGLNEAPLAATRSLKEKTREDNTKQERDEREGSRAQSPSALSGEWSPTEVNLTAAKALGLTGEDIRFESARFRDWNRTHGKECIDWNAAWSAWCVTAAERRGRTPDQGKKPAEPEQPDDPRWTPIKQQLVSLIGEETYGSWFKNAVIVSMEGDTLVLGAPTQFIRKEWENCFFQKISAAVCSAYPNVTKVEFKVRANQAVAPKAVAA